MSKITKDKVIDDFYRACQIEKMLPEKESKTLICKISGFYDIVSPNNERVYRGKIKLYVTPQQMDFMDEVISRLALIGSSCRKRNIDGRKIIWAKANGFSFRKIALVLNISHQTCYNYYTQDINIITHKLNSTKKTLQNRHYQIT